MRTIKRYTNRKLYCNETNGYVTLRDIYTFHRAGEEFEVIEDRSGADITKLTTVKAISQVVISRLEDEIPKRTWEQ